MKRSSGVRSFFRWLSVCLFCISLLAACGPSAERFARQTLAAMTASAVVWGTPAQPQGVSQTPGVPLADTPSSPDGSTPAQAETITPWVWINNATDTPVVITLPVQASFTATATPTITLTPGRGPSPTRTRLPSTTSTITATARPPYGALRIDIPGEGSKIISPYEFQAAVARGEDGLVYVSLIGENEQEFFSEVLDYSQSRFDHLLVTPTLTFDFPGVAENARLVLQIFDTQHRIMALSSVDVILLTVGSNQVNPAQHPYDPFLIDSPDDGEEIRGKRLIVSGRAVSVNTNPILIELQDEDGDVIARREMLLDAPAPGETYTPFVSELEINITRQINARLVIRQESSNGIVGTIALSSVAVTLQP